MMRIALAQLDVLVGDVAGNTDIICGAIRAARDDHRADLIVFPELTVCGYPPEDLLFQAGLRKQVEEALVRIEDETRGIAALVGYPEYAEGTIFNSAILLDDARRVANYRKQCLPNYSVFDEERYFSAGNEALVADVAGVRVGVTICEDIWEPGPCANAKAAGAQLIVSMNGSPFDRAKPATRESIIRQRSSEVGLPIVYVNLVGGQDELVFDGGSAVVDEGSVIMRAPSFDAGVFCCDFTHGEDRVAAEPGERAKPLGEEEAIYYALVTGVRDYVRKNGFPGVVLGLSGGIDSALTLAIAADALGAEAVQAIMMPYRYTANISMEDAAAQARSLGVDYQVLPIEPLVDAAGDVLAGLFAGLPAGTTEENIQSRCRGLLLMAISNKTGRMVLATGNKSEMAVGYATLYGDMNGGFAPIKDCTKTLVYRLARYRNERGSVIPARVIEREPSAELAPDQKDSDSLPPYDVLDPILDALMVEDLSADAIVARGFERETVLRVLGMVRRNEYKRRQAAPGVRITSRAFGRDWRYPITSGYRAR
jgi:NAD+ synthase (glutamine-hydrolysing)